MPCILSQPLHPRFVRLEAVGLPPAWALWTGSQASVHGTQQEDFSPGLPEPWGQETHCLTFEQGVPISASDGWLEASCIGAATCVVCVCGKRGRQGLPRCSWAQDDAFVGFIAIEDEGSHALLDYKSIPLYSVTASQSDSTA